MKTEVTVVRGCRKYQSYDWYLGKRKEKSDEQNSPALVKHSQTREGIIYFNPSPEGMKAVKDAEYYRPTYNICDHTPMCDC